MPSATSILFGAGRPWPAVMDGTKNSVTVRQTLTARATHRFVEWQLVTLRSTTGASAVPTTLQYISRNVDGDRPARAGKDRFRTAAVRLRTAQRIAVRIQSCSTPSIA